MIDEDDHFIAISPIKKLAQKFLPSLPHAQLSAAGSRRSGTCYLSQGRAPQIGVFLDSDFFVSCVFCGVRNCRRWHATFKRHLSITCWVRRKRTCSFPLLSSLTHCAALAALRSSPVHFRECCVDFVRTALADRSPSSLLKTLSWWWWCLVGGLFDVPSRRCSPRSPCAAVDNTD